MIQRFLIVFAIVVIAAAARSETGVTDKEILIGSCAPLQQDLGKQEMGGARAYIEYINQEQGGVNGRKIRLLSLDDKFNTEGATECFNQLVKENVFAGAFFAGTAPTLQHAKMAMASHVPAIGMMSGANYLYQPFKRYVINVRATLADEMIYILEHLHKELGLTKIGVLYWEDMLGLDGLDGVKRFLDKHQLPMTGEASLLRVSAAEKTQEEVNAAIEKLRAAKPEVVVLAINYKHQVMALKRAQEIGWKPQFVLLAARDSIIKHAGDASEGAVWSIVFPHISRLDLPTVALHEKLMKKYQPSVELDIKTLEGFIHAVLLVEGLKRAGRKLTREKLIDAYEAMKGVDIGLGPKFTLSFSPTNHQGFNAIDTVVVVRDGKSVPVTDWKALKK